MFSGMKTPVRRFNHQPVISKAVIQPQFGMSLGDDQVEILDRLPSEQKRQAQIHEFEMDTNGLPKNLQEHQAHTKSNFQFECRQDRRTIRDESAKSS